MEKMRFDLFSKEMANHFAEMTNGGTEPLYQVNLDKEELYQVYLDAFPLEENQIFRVRRAMDCSCCKHFVRNIGAVVAIRDNKMVSIWDFESADERWTQVNKKMSEFVKKHKISEAFFSPEKRVGIAYTMDSKELINPIKWDHLVLELPRNYVLKGKDISSIIADYRDRVQVFKRALEEFSQDSIMTAVELINQGSLYRGDEYKTLITEFLVLKKNYDKIETAEEKELFAWNKGRKISPSIAKVRNSAIGTLLININEGMDLEEAVTKYEVITAPTNYKRSKPIFTQRMLEDAQKTITELGYLDSLERRYANADDISVNNILFSNKDTAKRIQGSAAEGLFAELQKETKTLPKKFDRVEEISIEKFISDVLPGTSEVEAYVENKHAANFMSLIAPVNKDSKTMFKWNNNFSWAYAGNVTDSIVKQNVKNAGGKVDGVLRFSIQWNDGDEWDWNDLDAHCIEPDGNQIYFRNCRKPGYSSMLGQLDIDIVHPTRGIPAVENITWPELSRMEDGVYKFFVHCYSGRGGRSGFRAEIEFNGQIYSFNYTKPLLTEEIVQVAEVTLKNGIFSIKELLPSNVSSKEIWGIKTNDFAPVSVICYSPNYWDEQNGIGNKHYFFMLKDCVNPELPNAWYNEFLNAELYPNHRKVMEALGSKAHVLETNDQLSGLGFSSTLRNELVVKVKGATERVLKIKF